MTIRFLTSWNGYQPGDVATLANEAKLISGGIARLSIVVDGPNYGTGTMAEIATDDSGNTTFVASDGKLIKPYQKTASSFVLIGDSITASAFSGISPVTSLTRSNNVVTGVKTNHYMVTGEKIKVSNAMPDDFNDELVAITRVDANTFTYPSVGADGSATLSGHPSGGVFDPHYTQRKGQGGWWTWLEGMFNGGIELAFDLSHGGWNANYVANNKLDHFSEKLTDISFSDVCVAIGVNDCGSGRTVAQISTDIQTICQWALDKGVRVWLETIKPVESGYTDSSTKNGIIAAVNRKLRAYANVTPNVYLVDTYNAVVNATTGHCIAGLTTDNIHSSAYMAREYLAPVWYAAMSSVIKPEALLPNGPLDSFATNTESSVLLTYGPWTNTAGGTAENNVTGNIAAGLKVKEGGSASVVCSLVARSDGKGYDQVVEFTATAANDYVEISIATPTLASLAGKKIKILTPFEITGNTAGNLKGCYSEIGPTNDGIRGYNFSGASSSSNVAWGTNETVTGCLVSPSVDIPSGASGVVITAIIVFAAGAGVSTIKIGRFGVLKVD